MKSLVVLAIALLLPQEKNEAEELFKKMEEKLAKATSVTVKMKGVMEQSGLSIEIEAELSLAGENRARAAFTMTSDGRTVSSEIVSDGKTTHVTPINRAPTQTFATLEKLGSLLAKNLSRGGVVTAIGTFSTVKEERADAGSECQAKDFNLGPKVKIDERETQVVEYKLTVLKQADIPITVWIDLATHLPVKRIMKTKQNTISETSLEFKLDEKIDATKFELPKEAK